MDPHYRDGGEDEPMLGGRPSLDSAADRLSQSPEKGQLIGARAPSSRKSKFFKITAFLCALSLVILSSFIFLQFFRAQQHPSPAQGAGGGHGHQHGGEPAVKTTTTVAEVHSTTTKTSAAVPSPTLPSTGDSENAPSANVSLADQLNLNTGFVTSDQPTTREYVFNVTRQLGAPDGYEKSMILVNGQSPGPLIEANTGDTIRVVVHNMMVGESTTIHWHGLDQRNTTWMDGAVGISQCGIPPGESFTYEFKIVNQRGTFWYHSHLSVQYADGLYGPFIIHDPSEMVPSVDDEKIIMIGDLHHRYAQELLNDYLGTFPPWSKDGPGLEPPPDNMIINGQHISNCSAGHDDGQKGGMHHGHGTRALGSCSEGSLFSTNVKSADRVRLRVISHSANAPYYFTIDNHTLEIVEMDGVEIEPLPTTRLFMNPGQRYSVIVSANQTAGNYLMRASVATHCFHLPGGMHHKQMHGDDGLANIDFEATAILSYDSTEAMHPPMGHPWDTGSKSPQIFGNEPWKGSCHDIPFDVPQVLRKLPAYEVGPNNHHYFKYRTGLDGDVWRTFINKTVYTPLENDAALWRTSSPNDTSLGSLVTGGGRDISPNQYMLISHDAELGAQIVINSQHMMSHPWHLQANLITGQNFQVVGWGRDFYGKGKTTWNLENPVRRDTVTVAGDSHVVIRIAGDNPGIWALHCHILWHAEGGMTLAVAQRLPELRSLLKTFDDPDTGTDVRNRFCTAALGRPALPAGSDG